MLNRMLFGFLTIAVASAFAASSYTLTLFDESVLNGKTLEPGLYKLQLNDNHFVLKHKKDATDVPGKIETVSRKYPNTAVRYNDKHELQEIYLGGTTKKIVIQGETGTPAGGL